MINEEFDINVERKNIKKMKAKCINQFIDGWDNIRSPLLIGHLVDKNIRYRHILATLLNFIDKGLISIKPIYKKDLLIGYEFEKKNIDIFKYKVYEKLNNVTVDSKDRINLMKKGISVSDLYVINRIIFNDFDKVTTDMIKKFYDDEECEGKETAELIAKEIYAEKLMKKELEIYGIINLKIYGEGRMTVERLTDIGAIKRLEWIEFAEKLKKDTFLKEKGIESIKVWGENLIYGITLNVCKLSIKEANRLYNDYPGR